MSVSEITLPPTPGIAHHPHRCALRSWQTQSTPPIFCTPTRRRRVLGALIRGAQTVAVSRCARSSMSRPTCAGADLSPASFRVTVRSCALPGGYGVVPGRLVVQLGSGMLEKSHLVPQLPTEKDYASKEMNKQLRAEIGERAHARSLSSFRKVPPPYKSRRCARLYHPLHSRAHTRSVSRPRFFTLFWSHG